MTSEEYITQNFGEYWLKNDWSPGDVIDALEEYGKHCAEIAFDDGFCLGFIDNHRPSFEEWWANFQRKEAIDDRQLTQPAVSVSFPYSIYEEELNKMKQLPQTQTSLMKQCEILRIFANKLGLYDAADFLRNYR